MTKQIILIFAVLCSVQVQANSRYTERDTVQHEFFHDATELFQPLQPVYLDGVVVPHREWQLVCQCHRRCNRFSRNASWLRRSVRTCETLVQPCRRKMVYSCRWRPHTLQRFAIQRCRVIHEKLP